MIFVVCLKSLAQLQFHPAFNSDSFNPRQMLDLATSLDVSMRRSSNNTSHIFYLYFCETQPQRQATQHKAIVPPFSYKNFDQGTLHQVLGELQPFPESKGFNGYLSARSSTDSKVMGYHGITAGHRLRVRPLSTKGMKGPSVLEDEALCQNVSNFKDHWRGLNILNKGVPSGSEGQLCFSREESPEILDPQAKKTLRGAQIRTAEPSRARLNGKRLPHAQQVRNKSETSPKQVRNKSQTSPISDGSG